jgi:hypothetical protein
MLGASLLRLKWAVAKAAPRSRRAGRAAVDRPERSGAHADGSRPRRIFAGVHFRSDEDAGEVLGRSVADFVTDHALLPARDDDDRR